MEPTIWVATIYRPDPHDFVTVELFSSAEKAMDYIEQWKHHVSVGTPRWSLDEYIDDKRVLATVRQQKVR